MSRLTSRGLPRLGRWPRLLLAGSCLLLAAASAASAGGATGDRERTTMVIVAARALPAGHRLAPRDLARIRWPARLVPRGAITDVHAALGRRVAGPMSAREPLGRGRLVGASLTAGLPAGTVAVPVDVAGARTADLLHPGERVSLIATTQVDADVGGDHDAPPPDVDVVASRLLVLSVLPDPDGTGTDLIIAADRVTALSLIRTNVSRVLAPVLDSP